MTMLETETSATSAPIDVRWTADFVLVDGRTTVKRALRQLEDSNLPWVVISRAGGLYLYAMTVEEVRTWLSQGLTSKRADDRINAPLEEVLNLYEQHASTRIEAGDTPEPIDLSWRRNVRLPSVERYVEVTSLGTPGRIGICVAPQIPNLDSPLDWEDVDQIAGLESTAGPLSDLSVDDLFDDLKDLERVAGLESHSGSLPASPSEDQLLTQEEMFSSLADAGDTDTDAPATNPPPVSPLGPPPPDDEGVTPIRYPSIEVSPRIEAGLDILITIDLARENIDHTQGGPTTISPQPSDWSSLELSVVLSCREIEFKGEGRGCVTIRRNDSSIPAQIWGQVRQGAAAGSAIVILAHFFYGTRFCGYGLRQFPVVGVSVTPLAFELPPHSVVVELAAQCPDITVNIHKYKSNPNVLIWQLVPAHRFDGLPPCLDGEIDLQVDQSSVALKLLCEFAQLKPGQHRERIEGFGGRLWNLAPQMFRDAYWALCDHYRRALTIQFICDEPHLPWELMRPVRNDESEIHPPLALKHSVARWIARWNGHMRNLLPGGHIFTIAPKYPNVSRRLPRAQTEADTLIERFGAQRVDGTRKAVTNLLEEMRPAKPVAILHFAGHGDFAVGQAGASHIKLEDGVLSADEIVRPEVNLGKACRTLVFFNACEAGATGCVLGEVGGWADAFLSRQFGGFIAPLWSVDDEDASLVAAELLDGILVYHKPIGEVMRDVRVKHGEESPTFYSYLYYGDVMAYLNVKVS
jgi:hypothetical protein